MAEDDERDVESSAGESPVGEGWVSIRRRDLGVLLAASVAVLDHLSVDHPRAEETWSLATAVSAAERALLEAKLPS